MSKFNKEIIDRILGKALYHFIKENTHPNGLAVIDEKSNTHVVIFIDTEDNMLKIQETHDIDPANDCRIADIIREEDLDSSRTLN